MEPTEKDIVIEKVMEMPEKQVRSEERRVGKECL